MKKLSRRGKVCPNGNKIQDNDSPPEDEEEIFQKFYDVV